MTDLDIARSVTPQPIGEIASRLGINPELLEPYGKTKAKIPLEALRDPKGLVRACVSLVYVCLSLHLCLM
jgi:formyltetrahydrofolate synthetase